MVLEGVRDQAMDVFNPEDFERWRIYEGAADSATSRVPLGNRADHGDPGRDIINVGDRAPGRTVPADLSVHRGRTSIVMCLSHAAGAPQLMDGRCGVLEAPDWEWSLAGNCWGGVVHARLLEAFSYQLSAISQRPRPLGA